MIHDESCAPIAVVKDLNKLIRKQMKAIDAVIDLHKDENGWCIVCNYPHPCSTIQAIEKELS
jgi:predicted deacylase